MTDFTGYLAAAVDATTGEVLQNYDFTVVRWAERFGRMGMNGSKSVPPMCPLAVACQVVEDYDREIRTGSVKVLVIDQDRGTVETYDQAKLDFEIRLEVLCG